jgi:hypothetical protein
MVMVVALTAADFDIINKKRYLMVKLQKSRLEKACTTNRVACGIIVLNSLY